MRSLLEEYRCHAGKVSDKWASYLHFYDVLFERYRNSPVKLLEIGIQNGGSLEIWSKYFPKAELIVGCDINPACAQLSYDDPRIQIVIGDANNSDVYTRVHSLSTDFHIVLDDGSHCSGDIINTFSRYFPLLLDGGVFVAEDLHCSYWQDYEGGLEHPASSINFFKRLVDFVNAEHWGAPVPVEQTLSVFHEYWGTQFALEQLQMIEEVRFRNSTAAVLKTTQGKNALGRRVVVGNIATISADVLGAKDSTLHVPDQTKNRFGSLTRPLEDTSLEPWSTRARASEQLSLYRELAQLRAANDKTAALAKRLQTELTDARTRPLKQLRRNLAFHILSAVSKATPPLPAHVAERYAISALKRDPQRIERGFTKKKSKSTLAYSNVVAEWEAQRAANMERTAALAHELRDGPLISVIVPVYNTEPTLLCETIESVRAQSYPNWELCIADDCSPNEEVRNLLRGYAAHDSRIRIVLRDTNGHISVATNSALEIATGTFFAFLDHDDLLDRDALLLVAKALRENPRARIVYTDEDIVAVDGTRSSVHFKPDWNRLFLYENNYICHFCVIDAALIRQVGGLRKGFEGAQDHDLLLRCAELIDDSQVIHVPKVLYSWRAPPGSVAASPETKPYASEAGRRAVEEHLQRTTGRTIEVTTGPLPFTYWPRWPITGTPLVSIIMPTRDNLDVLQTAVSSILQRTAYPHFEIIIVDNGSREPATLAWLNQIASREGRVRVLRDDRPFNYSALNNAGAAVSKGEYLALLNNDVEVISAHWLEEMISLAQRDKAGCIGAKLYYPDGSIQHAGAIVGICGRADHSHRYFRGDHPGYLGRLRLRQEYSAVTGACLLIRRSLFDGVGGLNEVDLPVGYSDIDLCLKVQAAGYRNAWTPHAELYHHESKSRGRDHTPDQRARAKKELAYMKKTWRIDSYRDPAYNPNFSLTSADFSFGPPAWKI